MRHARLHVQWQRGRICNSYPSSPMQGSPIEVFAKVKNADLYYCEIGEGSPLIVLHGGPEFDHSYLRPGMDMLADSFHLIYYDQRGRGRSSGECENISVESEIADLENIREHLQLEQIN